MAHARMGAVAERLGIGAGVPLPLAYACGGLRALVGREPVGLGESEDLRWHISVNGANRVPARVPTWRELVDAAHALRPGIVFVVGVPPRSWWLAEIESGRYVLHLWEVHDENLVRSWFDQRTPGGRAPS